METAQGRCPGRSTQRQEDKSCQPTSPPYTKPRKHVKSRIWTTTIHSQTQTCVAQTKEEWNNARSNDDGEVRECACRDR